jgi:DNA-binding NarL/FixJ family response regulator
MSLTVIIADDYELMRKGILSVLQEEPDLSVMGECSTGEELLELVSSCFPGVAIVDVAIRKLDIFAITKRIKALSPATRVIVLSGHADRTYLRQLLDAGIAGYVLRTGPASDLVEAVRRGTVARAYVSPAVAGLVGKAQEPGLQTDSSAASRSNWLSPRQSEVLRLIAEGHSSKEIATKLGIGESTVKSHRKSIMERLEIHDKVGLTRYAMRIGLIRAH